MNKGKLIQFEIAGSKAQYPFKLPRKTLFGGEKVLFRPDEKF
jgi:hypothetical protein